MLGKGDADHSGPHIDPADSQLTAYRTDFGQTPQQLHLFRRGSETVDDLIHQVLFFPPGQIYKTAVQFQLVPGIGNIGIRNIGIQRNFQNRIRFPFHIQGPIPEPFDSLLQQIAVGGKSDSGNITMLLRPQQITGAPDLQVPHGNFKTRPQFRKITDGLQPLGRYLAEGFVLPVHKVSIGKTGRTPYPPPHLVQLRQTEILRPVHDDRIGQGHVQSVFHNRSTQQYIATSFIERHHGVFQPVFTHLPMTDAHIDARHQPLQPFRNQRKTADTVMNVIDPAAPAQLPLQGFLNHALVIFRHIGFHRQAILRRRLDETHIPAADQSHMQRTGNRRSR